MKIEAGGTRKPNNRVPPLDCPSRGKVLWKCRVSSDQEERKIGVGTAGSFSLTETPKHRNTELPKHRPHSRAATAQQAEHAEAAEKRGGGLGDHCNLRTVEYGITAGFRPSAGDVAGTVGNEAADLHVVAAQVV